MTIPLGKKVILTEAKYLLDLAEYLDDNFTIAVNAIKNLKGKLIVCGMGKSGYIGKKIAATFCSTGTPAVFLHPAEACHGDLGIICKNDIILIISNSGNTEELIPTINYCKKINIPIIGVTKNENSILSNNSNIILLLPEHEEACSFKLAPTVSTTLCLALGDALAVCCYKEEFSKEKFKEIHPGGSLGKS